MGTRKVTLADYGTTADSLHQKKVAIIEFASIIINNPFNINPDDRLQLCKKDDRASFMVRVTKTDQKTMECVPV